MGISTFNFWFLVAPAFLLVAIYLAIFSVTETEYGELRLRGSNLFWYIVMILYTALVIAAMKWLLIEESILGMLELMRKSNPRATAKHAEMMLALAALAWGLFVCCVFSKVRYYRVVRIEGKPTRKPNENVQIYTFSKEVATRRQGDFKGLNRSIEKRARMKMLSYRIEKTDAPNSKVEELLPSGVYEYYIATNINDESDAIYLGYEGEKVARNNLFLRLKELEENRLNPTSISEPRARKA